MPVPASRGALDPPAPVDGAPPLPALLPPAPCGRAAGSRAGAAAGAGAAARAVVGGRGRAGDASEERARRSRRRRGKSLGISSSLRMTGSRAGRAVGPRELAEHKAEGGAVYQLSAVAVSSPFRRPRPRRPVLVLDSRARSHLSGTSAEVVRLDYEDGDEYETTTARGRGRGRDAARISRCTPPTRSARRPCTRRQHPALAGPRRRAVVRGGEIAGHAAVTADAAGGERGRRADTARAATGRAGRRVADARAGHALRAAAAGGFSVAGAGAGGRRRSRRSSSRRTLCTRCRRWRRRRQRAPGRRRPSNNRWGRTARCTRTRRRRRRFRRRTSGSRRTGIDRWRRSCRRASDRRRRRRRRPVRSSPSTVRRRSSPSSNHPDSSWCCSRCRRRPRRSVPRNPGTAAPPAPHALLAVPVRQVVPEQQPLRARGLDRRRRRRSRSAGRWRTARRFRTGRCRSPSSDRRRRHS